MFETKWTVLPVENAARRRRRRLATGPSAAATCVKALFRDRAGSEATLAAEAALQRERFLSWEHHEGVAAFREKRAADYVKRKD